MKNRFKAILLMMLCLLVEAVSVYPHHHHADALCTRHGREASSPARTPQPCSAGCITHFQLTLPSVSFSVREVQKTPILYKVAFRTERVGFLSPLLQGDRKRKENPPVILHASPPTGGTGLRAPPSSPLSTSENSL